MTPGVDAARAAGIEFELLEYEHSGREGYGLEAAHALGLPPEQVFKTLIVTVDGRRLAAGIVPVSTQLDLKAIAKVLGGKRAEMADPQAAQRATGYIVGGISPLGQKRPLPAALDASAMEHERICISAGRRGLDISLAPGDLVAITGASVAPIAR